MNKIKLHKSEVYTLMARGWNERFLKKYNGYDFVYKGIIFEVFKNDWEEWQLNWCGAMIASYKTLKELKEDFVKNEKIKKLIDDINNFKIEANSDYVRLINEL
jgi:hypothetical protein